MRRLLVLIIVLALTAAACSDSSGNVVATVGGTDITEGDVGSLFESDTLPIDENLREAIFALVAREVLLQGLDDDFGVALDQEGVDALYSELVTQMETAGLTPGEFIGIPDASLEMVQFNADIGVIRQQAIDQLAGRPGIIEAFFSNPAGYTTVCARHILVETEEEANDVLARLEADEAFEDVAVEVSLDAPSGDLGCSLASRFVTQFAEATMEAAIGEYYGPVETDFGFHVLVVDERSAPTEAEFAADPLTYLSEEELQALWGQWLNDKIEAADVTVDEKFGFWTDIGIVPPDRPDLVPAEE